MIWYPYQQMKTMKPPIEVVDAKGVYLYTKEVKLIDSISSWWSVIHGYSHPVLNQAIEEQMKHFSHIMLGGLTHEPVQKLSDKLAAWLPKDLNYCFFSDSGSVAVEVALKMALQFHTNQNSNKDIAHNNVLELEHAHHRSDLQNPYQFQVLALEHAYHGDTFKTMEVGDDEDYHFAFGEKKGVIHIPTTIEALEEAFQTYGESLSCFLVEPLLQGAGGMRMYGLDFLIRARQLCDQYDVLLIFDEVATGFGRTGYRFVADMVCPDILVLGKALTGGYIGHAVTVANKKVYDGFYSDDPSHAFMHGPTFMGNALACSVALASIEVFEKEDYMSKIKKITEITKREMAGFEAPGIKEIRIMGGCICIEVYDSMMLSGYAEFAYQRGIFSRPFLNYMYAMVPYIITEEELVKVLDTMKAWFRKP